MGLHREIERMLARPADSLLVREIIAFWSRHRQTDLSADQVASQLHRPIAQVESILAELARAGVLSRSTGGAPTRFSYRLSGTTAFEVEQFARSRDYHEQKLVRSTDRFRSMYQRKSSH